MYRDAKLILACVSWAVVVHAAPGSALAQTQQTEALEDSALDVARRYQIPSLPVNQALLVFGRQAGITVVFSAPPGSSLPRSRPVDDIMTGENAIRQMLAGADLHYVRVDQETYSVRLAQEARPGHRPRRREVDPLGAAPLLPTEDVIVVTGTSRPHTTAFSSVAGVDVIRAEEIRANHTSGELVTTLSALAPSIDAPRSTLNGTPEAVRNIRFRGLSPDQLLVLVNGQRRHTSAVVHASSIYRGAAGADINAIPQIAIERIEVLRDGAAAQYGADAVTGVINFILKDAPEGGQISVTAGSHVTRIPALRETAVDGGTFVIAADQGYHLGDKGGLRFGGELTLRGETDRAGRDQVPPFVQLPSNSPLRGARNYHLGDGELTNLNLYSTLDTANDIGQSSVFGHATIGLRTAESDYFFRYPGTQSTDDTLYPGGFRPVAVGHNVDLASAIGLRRALEDWRLEVMVSHGANYFENRLESTLNASLGPASPTSFRIGALAYSQTALQATAFVDMADTISLTFGAETRFERHRTSPADPAAYQAGPFIGREIGAQGGGVITPADADEKTRTSVSAFAALELDANRYLSFIGAARVDNANDYGKAFTGRVGANLSLGTFMLRASGSSNYRAPNLGQLNYSVTNSDFSNDLRLVRQLNLGGDNPLLSAFGFSHLRSETSVNWTLGGGFRKGNLQATADAYVIRIDDRIATTPLISADAAVAVASEIVGSDVESVRFPINRYDTETVGIDLVASSHWDIWGGQFSLRGALSLVETRLGDINPVPERLRTLAPSTDWSVLNTDFGSVPFSNLELQASFRREDFKFSWRSMRVGESEERRRGATGIQVYAPDWRHDTSLAWRPVDGLEARVGAENVFDAYPDETVGVESYFGNFPYGYNRPIGINGRYVFASLRKYW